MHKRKTKLLNKNGDFDFEKKCKIKLIPTNRNVLKMTLNNMFFIFSKHVPIFSPMAPSLSKKKWQDLDANELGGRITWLPPSSGAERVVSLVVYLATGLRYAAFFLKKGGGGTYITTQKFQKLGWVTLDGFWMVFGWFLDGWMVGLFCSEHTRLMWQLWKGWVHVDPYLEFERDSDRAIQKGLMSSVVNGSFV